MNLSCVKLLLLFLLSEGSRTLAENYVSWIWHQMSMGSHASEMERRQLYFVSTREGCWCLWITIASVLQFVYVDLYANGYIPALYIG